MIRVEEFHIAIDLISRPAAVSDGPVRNPVGDLPAWKPASDWLKDGEADYSLGDG